jgi:hypothetical protein
MEKGTKYVMITVESFPSGWETNYFYLPVGPHLAIGDVITSKGGKQYRIVDGKSGLSRTDIDESKYRLFE